jgi:hypothetical protein
VLRLKFQEFEDLRSGETLSLLQKVRADSERFINAFINTAFAAVVGMASWPGTRSPSTGCWCRCSWSGCWCWAG